jgi:hypothetical protein
MWRLLLSLDPWYDNGGEVLAPEYLVKPFDFAQKFVPQA